MSSNTDSPTPVETIVDAASDWPEMRVGPHRFNAVEFLLADHEIGHIHRDGGMLDINFPKRMRDTLVEEDRTGDHHFAPNTGWTSYRVRSDDDVDDGLWLLRVSYLYRALTQRRKPVGQAVLADIDVAAELDDLGVSDDVRAIFENVVELNSLRR